MTQLGKLLLLLLAYVAPSARVQRSSAMEEPVRSLASLLMDDGSMAFSIPGASGIGMHRRASSSPEMKQNSKKKVFYEMEFEDDVPRFGEYGVDGLFCELEDMQNFVDVWHQDWKYNRDARTDKKYRRKATGLMKISAEEDDKDEMREAMLEEMKDMDFASLEDTPDISSPLEAEALGEKNSDGAAFAAEAGVSVDRAPAPEMMALGHVLRASAPRRSSEPEMKHRSAAISGRKKSTEGTRTPYDIRDPLIKGLSEAELKLIAQKTWMPVAVDRAKANKKWYLVDAEGMRLGRMASEIAKIVLGKHKPTFTPGAVMGDYVIVINADKVIVTGNKYNEKLYRRHSGYKGGLKVETFKTLQARIPERIVEKAVFGMLPKNRFGKACFHLLNVYKGPEHPHEAQLPQQITFSGLSARAQRTTAKDTANEDYEGSGSIELIEATGKTDFAKAEVIPNRIDGYR